MGSKNLAFVSALACFVLFPASMFSAEIADKIILQQPVYLSIGGPEWDIFERQTPSGTNLVTQFDFQPSGGDPHVLLIDQEDVKQNWKVELNGKKIGELYLSEQRAMHRILLPAGALKSGPNIIAISAQQPDDILLHAMLVTDTNKIQSSLGTLNIAVTEGGKPIPARITVIGKNSANGVLMPVFTKPSPLIAARPGVVYTALPETSIQLINGSYIVYASRGPEYTVSTNEIAVIRGETNSISVELKKAVDTNGLVSTDPHIHTLTLSKHGDATLDERLVTIAGEGLKMPITTEHNLHASYEARARELGLDKYFDSVAGNEVTTKQGHFNIFPVPLDSKPPDHNNTNWVELITRMREIPGVQMVILNHPCDVHSGFKPFAHTNFNWVTGKNMRGDDFTFNAMEVINSGAMRSDWMEPFRGWFGLLNRGLRIVGVAGSDSHDVSRFVVGQGRTYISMKGDKEEPETKTAIENLSEGRAIASLGLIPRITVNGQFGPGDLAGVQNNQVEVSVKVRAPGWLQVTNIAIFINGQEVKGDFTKDLIEKDGSAFTRTLVIGRKQFDYHIVAIATGPGVTVPYWQIPRPYQPSSREFAPVVIGAANPVFVDSDGDGKWTSPRATARKLLTDHGAEGALQQLAQYDWSIAAQLAEMLVEAGELDLMKFKGERYKNLPPESRRAFEDFFKALAE